MRHTAAFVTSRSQPVWTGASAATRDAKCLGAGRERPQGLSRPFSSRRMWSVSAAAANAKFPHDTTLNQWFTESQFESYRALGAHTIAMIADLRDDFGNILYPQPILPGIG